jgi:hypothetical protein
LASAGITTQIWVILNKIGLEASTCLLAEHVFDEEKMKFTDDFRAARLPLEEAFSMFANLEIENMRFEEYVNIKKGVENDGAYVAGGVSSPPSNDVLKESRRRAEVKKAKALNEARLLGLID